MTERVLTLRELNRTLLARQMLIERANIAVMEAVERLVGLQAQIPNPPYIGLWTRLQGFRRDDLTDLMMARQIVRAAMMRSTLHLITADDHQRFRGMLQPALSRALNAFFGQRAKGLDIDALVEAARPFLEAEPRSTGNLKNRLLEVAPDRDPDAMAYAVRNFLPLVQVPPGGTWGTGSGVDYVTAESWFGPLKPHENLRPLLHRYLAAFGPASVMDFQTWTGMVKLKDELEPLKSEMVIYRDENGIELLDLPNMPLSSPDFPAPVRFIPEYDNILIAHADRRRIIADEDRNKVFLSAGRVIGTILLDGFVGGTWRFKREKKSAVLTISPFAPLAVEDENAVRGEAEILIRFIEDNAVTYDIQVTTEA